MLIDIVNHRRIFTLVFSNTDIANLEMVEKIIGAQKLKSKRKQIAKRDARLVVTLEIYGNKKQIKLINENLVKIHEIIQF
jgi:hypothetical protein